ncbi:MAG: LTA synthase family protein [Clostridiales bacterium]|nr:LTA synthase family protein [Clostridiales bacterium]
MKQKILKISYLVFILFAIKMMVYYLAVDIPVFSSISYLVTLVFFGLALYLYCNSSERTKRILRFIYVVFSIVLFVDVIYYNYFNQLVSVNQIWQIKNIKGTEDSVKSAIPLMSIVILIDLPIIWILRKKFKDKLSDIQGKTISTRRKRWIAFGLVFSIIMIALNPFRIASLQKINSTEAVTVHVKDAVEATLGKVIYNQSSLSTILQNKSVPSDVVKEVSEEVIDESQKETSGTNDGGKNYAGIGNGMNLIVIQVESMQNFVLNTDYEGQEITPNLNKLLKEDTLYFNHYYTNMGKGNTSDAEFSTQTSLYPVIEGASYDLYVDNDFLALPKLMAQKGYYTSAAIGDDKDFYNRATIYPKLGYDYFYNEENLEMDELSGLGLSDKSLFRQMAKNLAEQESPFYSFIITLTNHYPYVLDEPLEATLKLNEKDKDTLFGGYLQTIRYTDEAIGEFIEALKDEGIYDNTIIAIYGDHHGLNCLDDDNYERMTEFLGFEYDYDTMLNIPLLIHIPGLGESKAVETVGGQVDFLPTIANFFDLDLSESVTFGQDLLNTDEGFVATVAYMLQGSFIKDGVLYEIGRDGTFEGGRAIDLYTHEPVNLDGLEEYSQKAVTMTEMSKYILEHNEALTPDDEFSKMMETIEADIESEESEK